MRRRTVQNFWRHVVLCHLTTAPAANFQSIRCLGTACGFWQVANLSQIHLTRHLSATFAFGDLPLLSILHERNQWVPLSNFSCIIWKFESWTLHHAALPAKPLGVCSRATHSFQDILSDFTPVKYKSTLAWFSTFLVYSVPSPKRCLNKFYAREHFDVYELLPSKMTNGWIIH